MIYIAILVGAIVSTAFGLLWFGPLFGKMWSDTMGFTPEAMADTKAKGTNKTYAISFLFEIVTAFVLWELFSLLSITTIVASCELVAIIWIGFTIPVEVSKVTWMGKPWKLFYLNSLHRLFAYLLVGITLILIAH